jgi:ribosomal protein L11 methyltransferase
VGSKQFLPAIRRADQVGRQMYSLRLKCATEEVDFLSAELWEAGTAGIRELEEGQDVVLIAGFETNQARAELMARFASRGTTWTMEDSTDWIVLTEQSWPPRLIGSQIFLAPTWCAEETPEGRVRVVHNPGLACGTGEHPCTQLALAALEAANVAGNIVVDIGTGSGLLAIAALRLGARIALGIDLDEAALSAARENLELNNLPSLLAAGSAECVRKECAAVTVANISGTVLLSIGDELLRISAAGSLLILTGFTKDELPAIEQLFGEGAVTSCDEWRCLSVRLS